MAREDFRFVHRMRVRWVEVDAQGVVFNGNYLTYFDVAMTEYFRVLDFPYQDLADKHGADLVVVRSVTDYHSPARFDDEIDVYVRTGRIGRSSFQLLFEIYRDDEHLISGELVYVNVDIANRSSKPLPHAIRSAIEAYEQGKGSGAE